MWSIRNPAEKCSPSSSVSQMAISRASPPALPTDNWHNVGHWWRKSCRWPCMASQPVLKQKVCSGSSETQAQPAATPSPTALMDKAAGKSWQLHPSSKVREWSVGTYTFTWYFLVCHPDPGALGRCLYSALTKTGAGRGRWPQKLPCSCFLIENTVQHTVRRASRSHPVSAPAHS